MTIKELIAALEKPRVVGPLEGEITSVSCDSRHVTPYGLFAAIKGEKSDGHAFVSQVLEQGVRVILSEREAPAQFAATWIQVKDARAALADAANLFFRKPTHALLVGGVTGTNGKTTTAFILQHLIASSRGRCGLIGTVRYDLGGGHCVAASRTTPDPVQLQSLFAQMIDHGCAGVAMEVSSHALDQQRTRGIEFDAAIFTNLTQDHLDYHKTMENYFAAKAKFADHLAAQLHKKEAVMVINVDDPWGKKLAAQCEGKVKTLTFGQSFGCDFRIAEMRSNMLGSTFTLEARGRSFLVKLPLIGRFNIFNAVGALAAAYAMGLNLREAVKNLAKAPQVPGRMQSVGTQKTFRVFVDYAHTPDAVENALRTLRDLQPERIITVFGCGGDRDPGKRPLMAAAAEAFSTHTIITSDNPRSEDPEKILNEIARGFRKSKYERIVDRAAAIQAAIDLADTGDIVLIAGKGHEAEQIFADRTVPFDDVKVAALALKNRKHDRRI